MGSGFAGLPGYVINPQFQGAPEPITEFMIPVLTWSDGTPAPTAALSLAGEVAQLLICRIIGRVQSRYFTCPVLRVNQDLTKGNFSPSSIPGQS